MNDLLADCRQLAAVVAPELAAAPLYILDAPPGWNPDPSSEACALVVRDCEVEQHLRDTGAWKGAGRTIIFHPERIATAAESHYVDKQAFLLAAAVHELAHAVRLPALRNKPAPTPREVSEDVAINRRLEALQPEADRPFWFGDHGCAFIRAAIHLARRGWKAGYEFPGAMLAHTLTPLFFYDKALGDEPERFATKTFDEIKTILPPVEFTDLYFRDVAAWHLSQSKAA